MYEEILRSGQAAKELGVHRDTVKRWAGQGRFPGARFDGREWRIPKASLFQQDRFLCGESEEYQTEDTATIDIREAGFVELLEGMETGSVDLILTDPPYTISRDTGFKHLGENSVERFAVNMDFGEWDKTVIDLCSLTQLTYSRLRRGGTAIIWYDLWKLSHLSEAMLETGFKQLRLIVWEKSNPVPLNQSVNYLTNSREIALLGVKVGNPTFNAKYHSGVFKQPIPRDGGKRLHPTQKPVKLFRELVQIHSNPNDLVVDPFLGSGTTAVAALDLGREFIGGDIDPHYVEVSIDRVRREVSR